MRTSMVVVLSALTGLIPACQVPADAGQKSEILAHLEQKHPDRFKTIAVHGTDPAGRMLLYVAKQGGTYLFTKKTDQVEEIHHMKFIAPKSITRITYSEGAFVLWAGDTRELSIGVSQGSSNEPVPRTIEGVARDGMISALVVDKAGVSYMVPSLGRWPDGVKGKRVRVKGGYVRDDRFNSRVVDGELQQGTAGNDRILLKATYELIR